MHLSNLVGLASVEQDALRGGGLPVQVTWTQRGRSTSCEEGCMNSCQHSTDVIILIHQDNLRQQSVHGAKNNTEQK